MRSLQVKKGPILVPLIALAAALAVYTLLNFRGTSAASCLSLGQQRLNELDHGGAVAAFTQAIELDPTSREARIGLAQAYAGTESYDVAQEVLADMVYTEQPDQDAAEVMIDLLRQGGQTHQAVRLAQTLVESTDSDESYSLRDSLLTELFTSKRSLAQGTDQALIIANGAVLSRGSNALGQLGLDPSEGTERYVSARFSGTPVKVACIGRTSLVVDASGALWAAGENRWGQMGEGYAVTAPQSGWRQVPCPGAVADVAGTTGRLLALLQDGSLWTAGAGTGQALTRLERFPLVVEIAANSRQAVVLTAGGRLYRSYSDSPEVWELAASDVSSFSLSEDALCWVGSQNQIGAEGGRLGLPDAWYVPEGIVAGEAIDTIASANGLTLFTAAGGRLCRLPGDGSVEEVETEGVVTALYPRGQVLVLEYANGTAQYWAADMSAPAPLEQY